MPQQSADAAVAAPLQDATGGYAMLAIDQRESLRSMFSAAAGGAEIDDQTLVDFKTRAVELLAPHTSAVLIDRGFGTAAIERLRELGTSTLILSADVLHQPRGGELSDATLDPAITVEVIRESGAKAIKMLVLWHEGEDNARIIEQSAAFIALAKEAGVASLLEAVVRPSGAAFADEAARHRTILEAAPALCALGPDIYKAQVPGYIAGDLGLVEEHSRALTASIDVPWVVLSNGIRSEDFSDAVQLATKGGADGFLAGRAIWADAIAGGDADAAMAVESVARLERLGRIVASRRD